MKLKKGNKIICAKPTLRKTPLSKSIGLLFRKSIREDEAHIFVFKKETYLKFHMFFVFTPIDIIFLDKKMNVVDYKKSFKPFTTYKSKKKSCYAIEVKENMIKKYEIKKGDTLKF